MSGRRQNPAHFRITGDRGFAVAQEVEKADVADGRAVFAPLDRPHADPDERPRPYAGEKATPGILRTAGTADMLARLRIGEEAEEIIEVREGETPHDQSFSLDGRRRRITALRVVKRKQD